MSIELEAATIDSHREFFRLRPKHAKPIGSPCPNCDTVLQGPWCHQCGQSAEDLHRSVLHLAGEAIEGFTHFDGRFWRTLPRLLLKPGELTRDYIGGHRASQVPPLRLFLVVLLIFFFAGSLRHAGPVIKVTHGTDSSKVQLDTALADMRRATAKLGRNRQDAGKQWFKARIEAAAANPERFKEFMREWVHRAAIAMLPISAAILSLLFVLQRRFLVFDHLIFSMHSLSFQGLLLTPAFLFGGVASLLAVLSPIHLFVHMRGAYGTSVVGTLVRMALLGALSFAAFIGLMLGLILLGLSAMSR